MNELQGEKMWKVQTFPDTLLFVIIPGMFWRNLTKIRRVCTPYKFTHNGCIPPKIKCEILARKGSLTTRTTPEDYLALWNRKPMEQQDILALMTMVMISREKHGMETFFLPRCRIEEKDTYMGKV